MRTDCRTNFTIPDALSVCGVRRRVAAVPVPSLWAQQPATGLTDFHHQSPQMLVLGPRDTLKSSWLKVLFL